MEQILDGNLNLIYKGLIWWRVPKDYVLNFIEHNNFVERFFFFLAGGFQRSCVSIKGLIFLDVDANLQQYLGGIEPFLAWLHYPGNQSGVVFWAFTKEEILVNLMGGVEPSKLLRVISCMYVGVVSVPQSTSLGANVQNPERCHSLLDELLRSDCIFTCHSRNLHFWWRVKFVGELRKFLGGFKFT